MASKIIRDDLRYLVFSEVYLRFSEPKSRRKAFAILEAAITCYAKRGWDRTTIEMVAREAGGTRAQVQHYFPSAADLRDLAIRYIRLVFQKFVIDQVMLESTPERMLEVYIRSCFRWVDQSKKHALVWLSFLHAASNNKKDKELNSKAVAAGTERITSLVQQGNSSGAFNCTKPAASARAIQVILTGAMITYASEIMDEGSRLEDLIVDRCFALVSASLP